MIRGMDRSSGNMTPGPPWSFNRLTPCGDPNLWKTPDQNSEFWSPCKDGDDYVTLTPDDDDCCRMCPKHGCRRTDTMCLVDQREVREE